MSAAAARVTGNSRMRTSSDRNASSIAETMEARTWGAVRSYSAAIA
jgi:hypothetical protein